MGCCGCSLAASTVTAVVLGLLESIIGLSWNILVVIVVQTSKNNSEFQAANTSSTTLADLDAGEVLGTETAPDERFIDEYTNDTWDRFKHTLTSDDALQNAHVFELAVTALVLNAFWLVTTLVLAVGNAEKCREMLKPWVGTTVIITIADIAATIYFVFKAVKESDGTNVEIDDHLFIENIFVLLATLFSRGGPIVWVANIALCIFVCQRIKEIEVQKKKRLPFGSDMCISPFSVQNPYAMYEGENYGYEKSVRPNTPPPDYEAQERSRNHRKHHHHSRHSSDCDTSTLPVSFRSSSSTMQQRPTSLVNFPYPYDTDDRVEMHHRASVIAESHHHAYDNKALDNDSPETWMGIPRPTLKINR